MLANTRGIEHISKHVVVEKMESLKSHNIGRAAVQSDSSWGSGPALSAASHRSGD